MNIDAGCGVPGERLPAARAFNYSLALAGEAPRAFRRRCSFATDARATLAALGELPWRIGRAVRGEYRQAAATAPAGLEYARAVVTARAKRPCRIAARAAGALCWEQMALVRLMWQALLRVRDDSRRN
jgi:hypothetical protein